MDTFVHILSSRQVMYAVSFENKAFNKGYDGVEIDMVFAPKAKYDDCMRFFRRSNKAYR